MAEKTKEEELKQKLTDFFEQKLTDLTTKIENDFELIKNIKFEIYDTLITKIEEIKVEHKKQEEEREKQEKERQEKEKAEKKAGAKKPEKIAKTKIDPTKRPKTPAAPKPKMKEEKSNNKTVVHKDKKDVKPKAGVAKSAVGGKAPAAKKDASKRPKTAKIDPKSKTLSKKGGANAKKVDPKKGKKGNVKGKKEESKKEEEPKTEVEEKKPLIINPKYIYNIPEDLKNKSGLSTLYFVLKGKYITDKKKFLHLATYSPALYKSFGSKMKFLLDDKKVEVQNKANEIEKFLNNYGDLNSYLTKEFTLNKKAINSIQFFKKKEEEEILKMPEIPKEVGMVLKCIYYIIDENFDENMDNKQLFENMLNNVLTRNEDKSFKSLLVNYCNQNKYLNLNKEKYDKINNTINENNTILNMIAMTKMCRPISLFCFLLKEVHDYINLKTLDGQFYFDLRVKNDELQKYKDLLYLIENDGKPREPPKVEEKPKEEAPKTEPEAKLEEVPSPSEEPPKKEEEVKKRRGSKNRRTAKRRDSKN